MHGRHLLRRAATAVRTRWAGQVGQLFRYIADDVARSVATGHCPRCGKNAPLFPIDAAPDSGEWGVNEDRVSELCPACIRALPLRVLEPRRGERVVQQMINVHFPKGTLNGEERINRLVSICDEFRRTPTLPTFLQGEDWPDCCGDFCEYLGAPRSYSESIRIGREMECWDGDFQELYGDVTLEPECLDEVSIFRCTTCDKRVFTWQCT